MGGFAWLLGLSALCGGCRFGFDPQLVDSSGVVDVLPPAPWGAPGWSYRKRLVIVPSLVDGEHVAFPLLVSLDDADLAAHAMPGGSDVLFTDADGTTALTYDLESYAAGAIVAWVKLPTLAPTTSLYIYFGNPASTPANAPSVWSDYKAVWHFEQVVTALDATSTITTTPVNMNGTNLVAGPPGLGRAARYNGTNEYQTATIDLSALPNSQTYTISAWARPTTNNAATTTLFAYAATPAGPGSYLGLGYGPFNGRAFLWHGDDTGTIMLAQQGVIEDATWHHVVGVRNGQAFQLYVDGALTSSIDRAIGVTTVNAMQIGQNANSAGVQKFAGDLDEIRLTLLPRTEAWIHTEFDSQRAGFYTVGPLEQTAL